MFALPLIGGAVQAMGALQGAGARSKAAQYNAAVSRNNAQVSRAEAQLDIEGKQREMRQALGSMRAAYGSSGIQFVGSGLDLLRDTSVEYAWDVQKIGYKGETRALSEQNQAKLYEMEAKSAKTEGFLGAATGLLKGASSAYSLSSGYGLGYGEDLA